MFISITFHVRVIIVSNVIWNFQYGLLTAYKWTTLLNKIFFLMNVCTRMQCMTQELALLTQLNHVNIKTLVVVHNSVRKESWLFYISCSSYTNSGLWGTVHHLLHINGQQRMNSSARVCLWFRRQCSTLTSNRKSNWVE